MCQKRKRSAGTGNEENPSKEKSVLRDVVLLPSPTIDCVPRGSNREKLYTQGCVISAFEIRDSHTENDIRKRMVDAFGEKLKDLPEPKFKFVRAVGNKIIDPSCETYTGKVLKYLNKQVPIYARAVSAISEQDLSDEEKETMSMDSDDDILFISAFEQRGDSSTKSTDKMQGVNEGASTSKNTEREQRESSTTRQHRHISVSDSPHPIEVNCPTCYRSYPASEIAEHADSCAEAADGFTPSRQMYGNLLTEFPCDDIHVSEDEETYMHIADEQLDSDQINLQECLGTLNQNVNEAKSTIYVCRKLLWEDYVEASTQSKWFSPDNTLKVNFIGEKAVDGEAFIGHITQWRDVSIKLVQR